MNQVELYKRGLNNVILFWSLCITSDNNLACTHGILNKNYRTEKIYTSMSSVNKEFESRVKSKKKEGYLEIGELRDNTKPSSVVDKTSYLQTYLPKYNSANNGNILPMLCKTLDSNKPFEKNEYIAQWKINGLRCLIGAEKIVDLFRPYKLKFQSREGTTWNLPFLESQLIDILDKTHDILDLMIEENAYLDGEIYLPGHTVNEINHFVKDPTCKEHKLLQYWCYDIAVENTVYSARRSILIYNFSKYCVPLNIDKTTHLNNTQVFNLLSSRQVFDIHDARVFRDDAINIGFEGLVMRNDSAEYQFGSRKVDTMYKYKKIEDGWFKVVDIVPEGKKRQDLAKLILQNDINNDLFECTCNMPQDTQREILEHRKSYIDGKAFVEYRERSGVKQVPFHAKVIKLLKYGVTGI